MEIFRHSDPPSLAIKYNGNLQQYQGLQSAANCALWTVLAS